MTRTPRVALSGLILVASAVAQAVIAFGANLIMVRHLDPAQFGRFAVVQASAALVLSILSIRTNTLIIRTLDADMDTPRRDLLFSVIGWETILAALLITALMVSAGNTEWTDWCLILALVIGHWTNQNRAFFERGLRFGGLAVIETVVQISGHGLAVVLVLTGIGAGSLYLRELFFSLAGLAALIGIGALSFYRFHWVGWAQWRAILRDGRGVWLDAMLENSFSRLTLLLVNAGTGLNGAGLFFQAQRLALVPQQFLQPISGRVAAAWFGQTECSGQRRLMRRRLLLVAAPPLLLAAILAWALADPVVPWIFGAPWAPAAPILAALAGMILFLPLFETLRSEVVASKRVRWLLVARLTQYGGLLIPLWPLLLGQTVDATHMGIALSVAYAGAFIVLAALILRAEAKA
jgi:O-antigen/teichoic acid export membrane protein